ncbi:acyltransferase [Salmonella enterica subsp. enterica serovar 6,14:a:1,7]|nr:acyltransferase [Salmonella enterica]EGL4889122.1 acyltransferase [Salmonella enterica]EJU7765816.1 acyltransferase [Salmonella enterica subsp. enterica serovar 6,14:a:1,7]EKH1725652.1 acyltransferase [Salmonella enterica]
MSKILKLEPDNHKYSSLDGARGVCASLVAIFHLYWRGGGQELGFWSLDYIKSDTTVHYILLTGELSVGVFFILSAFLFFKKSLSNTFDYENFYISRIMRIFPPVIASIVLIYISSFLISDIKSFQINDLIQSIPFIFNYPSTRINDIPLTLMNSGVLWTMVWELRLYVAIPLLFILLRKFPYPKAFVLCSMAYVMYQWYFIAQDINLSYIMYFLAGFMVASIQKEIKTNNIINLLILIIAIALINKSYDVLTPLIMMIVFYTLKCGCSYFGFLTSKPIKILGMCSFSIYLIHGIPQVISKHFLYNHGDMTWKLVSIVGVGVISSLMFKFVESPCIWRPQNKSEAHTQQA